MNIEIANKLVQLRKQNGFSQEELADKIGVSRQAVSKWERGESSPDTDNLIALARLYDVSLDEILLLREPAARDKTAEAPEQEKVEHLSDPVITYSDEPLPKPPHDPSQPPSFTSIKDKVGRRIKKVKRLTWRLFAFPYALIVGVIYVIVVLTGAPAHPTWLIFLSVPLYYLLIPFFVVNNKRLKVNLFPVPMIVVIVYLTMGLIWGLWHPYWVIFFLIPVYYYVANTLFKMRRKNKTNNE